MDLIKSTEDTAAAFFIAVERGDIGALEKICADRITIWHNFTCRIIDKRRNLATLVRLNSLGTIKYSVQEKHVVGNRFIQRHVAEIRLENGKQASIPAAIFMSIFAGRITSIEEYMDSAQIPSGILLE